MPNKFNVHRTKFQFNNFISVFKYLWINEKQDKIKRKTDFILNVYIQSI